MAYPGILRGMGRGIYFIVGGLNQLDTVCQFTIQLDFDPKVCFVCSGVASYGGGGLGSSMDPRHLDPHPIGAPLILCTQESTKRISFWFRKVGIRCGLEIQIV